MILILIIEQVWMGHKVGRRMSTSEVYGFNEAMHTGIRIDTTPIQTCFILGVEVVVGIVSFLTPIS